MVVVVVVMMVAVAIGGTTAWFLLQPAPSTPGTPISDSCTTCLSAGSVTDWTHDGIPSYNVSIVAAATGLT